MEYFDNLEWIDEKFGEKIELKFRIKETIHYYKKEEIHTYYPQVYVANLPKDYKIEHEGLDVDNNWAYLDGGGFSEIENAKKLFKKTIPYVDKWETKYHNI